MIVIDGSYGEGGGQILRSSLTLAALTSQPCRIERIRAGRKQPGLRAQHLTAVRAAAAICDARLEGDSLHSLSLTFIPREPIRAGAYTFDVAKTAQGGSAGAVGLILQTVLLPLILSASDSTLTIKGGTHVAWAPSASYLAHVYLPTLARMGVKADIDIQRWGFYPAGGGELSVTIPGQPGALHAITLLDRGTLEGVWGIAAVTELPSHIPQRMATRAENVLAQEGLRARVEPRRLRGTGPGAGIFLFSKYRSGDDDPTLAGFTAYGRKGLPAERVAEAACEELLAHHRSQAAIDPFLADQLVLPMALASSPSRFRTSKTTQHLLTNAWVVRQFVPVDIAIEGTLGGPGDVTISGQQLQPAGHEARGRRGR